MLLDAAWTRLVVELDKIGHDVAFGGADRVGAEGIDGGAGVARIADPLVVAAADDVNFVFNARTARQCEAAMPKIGALNAQEGHIRLERVDEVTQPQCIRAAAPDERRQIAL